MANYFDNFSMLQYNGQYCRNIVSRTALSQSFIKLTSAFYPYQAVEGERADVLSFLYYNTPNLDWLVYFANDVVDPYYDWHMSEEQFKAYIVSKYGSLITAQLKTHHYEVNWANDDTTLSISAYNALPAVAPTNMKQYWAPRTDENDTIVSYGRKPLNISVATNQTLAIYVADPSGFAVGEIVSQQTGNIVSGYAEIVTLNDDHIIVHHVSGAFISSSNIVGFDNQYTQTAVNVKTLSTSIPTAEQVYWRAITLYEYEEYLNTQRRVLNVIDQAYAETAMLNLSALMK